VSGAKERERQASSVLYTRHKDIVDKEYKKRLKIRRVRPVRHPDLSIVSERHQAGLFRWHHQRLMGAFSFAPRPARNPFSTVEQFVYLSGTARPSELRSSPHKMIAPCLTLCSWLAHPRFSHRTACPLFVRSVNMLFNWFVHGPPCLSQSLHIIVLRFTAPRPASSRHNV
jgi:hypothetical protein